MRQRSLLSMPLPMCRVLRRPDGSAALAALLLTAVLLIPEAAAAPLALELRGHRVEVSPFTLVAAPGETVEVGAAGDTALEFHLDGEALSGGDASKVRLEAPSQPGLYRLQVTAESGDHSDLNLFVTVPAAGGEQLNGYRLGPPPPGHERHPELYRAPSGFIEVTPELLDTRLTPHFTLGQFLCKQDAGFPKYVALREPLLLLLEGLLQSVREAGYPAETFGVISAYRTPWYNRSIGNVPNSRHVYGDAMDLFIDLDRDGRLDDLDRDGDRDRDDALVLARIAEEFMSRPENAGLVGGVGRYRPAHHHGGFVHVDTRGYQARW